MNTFISFIMSIINKSGEIIGEALEDLDGFEVLFEPEENNDMKLNDLSKETIQNLFLTEIFNYEMNLINTKKKILGLQLEDIRSGNDKDLIADLKDKIHLIDNLCRKEMFDFKLNAEGVHIEGIRKTVDMIIKKDILLVDKINAFNSIWLETNEKLNKPLKDLLTNCRLRILKEMQDNDIDDEYIELKKVDTDPPPKINPFASIKI
ncbi:hypothetical protein [Pseudomonas aeruginosa]|uniref:hypothetical protein n=1 Tax=Pseudomonas aeruginosa TaxID=287 RepID=UPI001048131C|nr:hypothetical protein [Pseudomonas aeruginosa]